MEYDVLVRMPPPPPPPPPLNPPPPPPPTTKYLAVKDPIPEVVRVIALPGVKKL
jgi:hypothetical protein